MYHATKVLQTFENLLSYAFVRPEFENTIRIPNFAAKCLYSLRKWDNPRILHIHVMSALNVASFLTFSYERGIHYNSWLSTIRFRNRKTIFFIANIETLVKKRDC